MKSGICPNCVKTIQINEDEVLGVCPFCGEPYEVSEALYKIKEPSKPKDETLTNQVSEEVYVSPPIEPTMDQAQILFMSEKYDDAFNMYQALIDKHSDDYLIWLGLALSISHNFTELENGRKYFKFMTKAKSLAPANALDEYEFEHNIYLKKVEQYELNPNQAIYSNKKSQSSGHANIQLLQFTSKIPWDKVLPIIALVGFLMVLLFSFGTFFSLVLTNENDPSDVLIIASIGVKEIFQVLTGQHVTLTELDNTDITTYVVILGLVMLVFWGFIITLATKLILRYKNNELTTVKQGIKYQLIIAVFGTILLAIFLGARAYIIYEIRSAFSDSILASLESILSFLGVTMKINSTSIAVFIIGWVFYLLSIIIRYMKSNEMQDAFVEKVV